MRGRRKWRHKAGFREARYFFKGLWSTVRRSMAVSSAKKLILNPEMLHWARQWRGIPLEQAAKAVKQSVERFREWETQRGPGPTIKQARKLAHLYDRSLLEFFRETKPEIPEPTLIPDFRIVKGTEPLEERSLTIVQMWAESKRANAIALAEELEIELPIVPANIFARLSDDEEEVAERVRNILKFDLSEQTELDSKDQYKLPDIIRGKLEPAGILTIRRSDIRKFRVRGMCVVTFPLPIILFGRESPAAQAFTICHELGHVILRQSAISGPRHRQANDIEKWCDRFASAFLMPRYGVTRYVGPKPSQPAPSITDDELLRFAKIFRVSEHAMLVRLVHLEYVEADYYWNVKKPEFDEKERKLKSWGRPKFYGKRFQSSLGDLYTGLVIGAWNSGKLTNHNAAEYMGIKNFAHLDAVRENFGKS
jgi:Zn-dependent peptidase ImmA (M78 family)